MPTEFPSLDGLSGLFKAKYSQVNMEDLFPWIKEERLLKELHEEFDNELKEIVYGDTKETSK